MHFSRKSILFLWYLDHNNNMIWHLPTSTSYHCLLQLSIGLSPNFLSGLHAFCLILWWKPASNILFCLLHGYLLLCPWLMMRYTERCGIVLTSLEDKWERILSWRYKWTSKAIEYMWKSSDNSTSSISLNLDNIFPSLDIVVLSWFIMIFIFRIRTVHSNSKILSFILFTLCHIWCECTFCL